MDESLFDDVKAIGGYMGAVVSDASGEVLMSDKSKIKKIEDLTININEDFRDIHKLTKKLSLGETSIMEIQTDSAVIVMGCGGAEDRVHVHAFIILSKDGSVGMAKIQLKSILGKIKSQLS